MESIRITLVFISALLSFSASQYIDVDSVTVSSPSYFTEGEISTVTASITFTPMDGAAAAIEGSNAVNRFMLIGAVGENDDGSGNIVSIDSANLTVSQQTTDMTDGDSVTWSGLTFEANMTNEECGNGTLFQYYCLALMPHYSTNWGAVDYDNASACATVKCKATVDLSVDSISMTNPDNAVLSVGGGQAVEITSALSSTTGSDDVVGAYNWAATTFLSANDDGSGTKVASTSLTIAAAQRTKDLFPSGSINLVDMAATYDLTDVTCDDFDYACVTVSPHSNANWRLVDSPTNDQTSCISVTCGAGFVKTSVAVMFLGFLLSHILNNS